MKSEVKDIESGGKLNVFAINEYQAILTCLTLGK